MAVFTRMPGLVCVYVVSTAVHLDSSGVHLRAARTCRARFSCREYVLWHCVHTCIIRRQGSRVRVLDGLMRKREKVEGRDSGGVEEERWTPSGDQAELRVAFAAWLHCVWVEWPFALVGVYNAARP